ncbi:transmembrane protein, putative [Bodo saltans]|uniref:Transmembrane protein, putative n=1 Tax=Bodo saltans TaxID=75058 RepID=A0A0S4J4C9_BODSA|nr:transmembrane protein, putative [Bodo saltans]|eukprot:CUG42263.1 transmembrane protein, putative [Bodo saltans]
MTIYIFCSSLLPQLLHVLFVFGPFFSSIFLPPFPVYSLTCFCRFCHHSCHTNQVFVTRRCSKKKKIDSRSKARAMFVSSFFFPLFLRRHILRPVTFVQQIFFLCRPFLLKINKTNKHAPVYHTERCTSIDFKTTVFFSPLPYLNHTFENDHRRHLWTPPATLLSAVAFSFYCVTQTHTSAKRLWAPLAT